MFDEEEQIYQRAVDGLDVKYIDGEAYMSIHTVDIINASIMSGIDKGVDMAEAEGLEVPDDVVNAIFWVMDIWRSLHDELEMRAVATTIPDTVPENLDPDKD